VYFGWAPGSGSVRIFSSRIFSSSWYRALNLESHSMVQIRDECAYDLGLSVTLISLRIFRNLADQKFAQN
jgi:hypothetical protein